jgi:tol-pal system protein YbgF
MKTRLLLAACGAAVVLPFGVAGAQTPGDVYQDAVPPPEPYETTNNKAIDRRLDRSEKALRELRAIVLKAQAQGSPVEVKPAGPDPILLDLQQRFGDLQQTVQQLNGQVEQLRYDLEQSRRDTAAAQSQVAALTAQMQEAAAAAGPPETPAPAAPSDGAASAVSEGDVYQQARQTLDQGDSAGGVAAMQAFIQDYPRSSRVPTAYYWIGKASAAQGKTQDAAGAFAQSLKGWPQASWAADATVQLATTLTGMKRNADACKALAEFDTRYAAKASSTVKAQAAVTRKAAACR